MVVCAEGCTAESGKRRLPKEKCLREKIPTAALPSAEDGEPLSGTGPQKSHSPRKKKSRKPSAGMRMQAVGGIIRLRCRPAAMTTWLFMELCLRRGGIRPIPAIRQLSSDRDTRTEIRLRITGRRWPMAVGQSRGGVRPGCRFPMSPTGPCHRCRRLSRHSRHSRHSRRRRRTALNRYPECPEAP